jgi:NNP family nitrate/nitrite transporter-like MFS transporter
LLGSIPVFGVAAANSYESFLFFRLLIGAIGASFVITQYQPPALPQPAAAAFAVPTTLGANITLV